MANNKCEECGCTCSKCIMNDHDVHLHVEIESLKQRLVERDNHILSMETNFLNEANKFPNGEICALREELVTWEDKYKRLYEAHRRVQRVNQGLEDKLLKLVDVCETDKSTLTKDVATLSHKLADANYTIKKLTEDNQRYKNDVALAIQFLQCKPGNFVSQKVETLPNEVQAKVSSYMASKRKPEEKKSPPEVKSIKVPIPTFPPTAMVYSIPKSPNATKKLDKDVESSPADIVSAAIMAKVLEERERERANVKHCDTCTCSRNPKLIHHTTHHHVSTQTGEFKNSLCLKCNSTVKQNPMGIKVVKNAENVKSKSLPIYIHDYESNQNVAKVQPNNFLTDKTISKNNVLDLKPTVSEHSKAVTYTDAFKSLRKSNLEENAHHRLCTFEIDSNPERDDLSAKNSKKGPRYCSMRLQSGSKNILLDNTHNNVAPILYTRHQDDEVKERSDLSESISSGGCRNSTPSDNSFHNQNNQRVAEWIESNMEVGVNTENSKSDSSKSNKTTDTQFDVNKEKYAEMENNVKRFLFGESEFLRTVEIGKRKYQTYTENENANSNTETEI